MTHDQSQATVVKIISSRIWSWINDETNETQIAEDKGMDAEGYINPDRVDCLLLHCLN